MTVISADCRWMHRLLLEPSVQLQKPRCFVSRPNFANNQMPRETTRNTERKQRCRYAKMRWLTQAMLQGRSMLDRMVAILLGEAVLFLVDRKSKDCSRANKGGH